MHTTTDDQGRVFRRVRDYSSGSIRDALLNADTLKDLGEMMEELKQMAKSGQLHPAPGTVAKWRRAAMRRLAAQQRAVLLGPDGRPVA